MDPETIDAVADAMFGADADTSEAEQATRRKVREHGSYDTTSLRKTSMERRVHRDYLAHVFRWGWADRYIGQRQQLHRRVVEAGCGQDMPLFNVFTLQQSYLPDLYVGVDLNSIPWLRKKKEGSYAWADVREKFNFVERYGELLADYGPTFDFAVSFEVIEHMEEELGDRYLEAIYALLEPGGELLISTPVFNGRKAANHIREYTVAELQEKLEAAGFEVVKRYGTFASYHDAKRGLKELYPDDADRLLEIYEDLRAFYGDNTLACFLAPLLPDHSRNNAWICRKPEVVS